MQCEPVVAVNVKRGEKLMLREQLIRQSVKFLTKASE